MLTNGACMSRGLLWTSVRVLRKFNRKYPWYLFINFGRPSYKAYQLPYNELMPITRLAFSRLIIYGRPSGHFNQYPRFMSVSAASYMLPSYRWSSSRPQIEYIIWIYQILLFQSKMELWGATSRALNVGRLNVDGGGSQFPPVICISSSWG